MNKAFKSKNLLLALILTYIGIVVVAVSGGLTGNHFVYTSMFRYRFWYGLLAGAILFPIFIFALVNTINELKGDSTDALKKEGNMKSINVRRVIWISVVIIATIAAIGGVLITGARFLFSFLA